MSGNAHAAINFEHAWGDGVAVLRYFNEVFKDKKVILADGQSQPTMEGVADLDFTLTPNVKTAVEHARKLVDEKCKSLSTNVLQYHKFGKKDIKKLKLSPDALMQLAFQVSHICTLCKQHSLMMHDALWLGIILWWLDTAYSCESQ